MTALQSYINPEEVEEQAKDNKLVDLKYVGPVKRLHGKRGKGYFINSENQWYFRPNGSNDEYRVNTENLDFER
jgi:hypothetical protein